MSTLGSSKAAGMGRRTRPLPDHTQLPSQEGEVLPPANLDPALAALPWPDHLTLPETDGSIVTNAQELPQGELLSSSLEPVLDKLHPEGRYIICANVGIYFRDATPELDGCKAPDWFYVPDVDPLLDGQVRRSFVMWRELVAPLLVIEFGSGDGSEERDRTPLTGKFWVYEHAIRPAFYAIYERDRRRVEVYHLVENRFELLPANERGHYPIPPLGIEMGIWQGTFRNLDLPWLRCWDTNGHLLLSGDERAEQERQRAEQAELAVQQERQRAEQAELAMQQEHQRAEQEHQRAERMAALLRSLGHDPDAVP
jgi:Uma2 family endonuclease